MNRSISHSASSIGGAALLALAGCSHNEPPKPPESSPPFESNVGPETSPSAEPSTPGQPGSGTPGSSGTAPGSPSERPYGDATGAAPRTGQPGDADQSHSSMGHGGQATPGTAATPQGSQASAMTSERDLCDALTRSATLQIENVQGGAAIVIKPRVSDDAMTVREQARQLEARMDQSPGSSTGPSCELFAIVRTGGTTALTEAPDAVRILITSSDPSEVQSIRRQAREFVSANAGKGGGQGSRGSSGGSQGSGSQQGGTRGSSGGSQGSGSQHGGTHGGSGSQGSGSQGSGSQGSGSQHGGTHGGSGSQGSGSQGSGSSGGGQ